MTTTLEALQQKVIAFRDDRDWEQFHKPKDLALGLQVEAAELAELFLWKTGDECAEALGDEGFRVRVEEELADVQIFLLYMAEVAGLSISEAVERKLEVNERKYPVEKARGSALKYTELNPVSLVSEPSETSTISRIIAVDWSGAKAGAEKWIWLCEVAGGEVQRLESGRSREEITAHLIAEAQHDPHFVVGFDFAFSFPMWFLEERAHKQVSELWQEAETLGETWLQHCEPPFWGKPGKKKPGLGDRLQRKTEQEIGREIGRPPMSVFQIGGAGAVGVGTIRGMPFLSKLRAAGFSIWPFDTPRLPQVIEIWPRIFMGSVRKSDHGERARFLDGFCPEVSSEVRAAAEGSDDAFDALVSAIAMDRHGGELGRLDRARDPQVLLEGETWWPGKRSGRG